MENPPAYLPHHRYQDFLEQHSEIKAIAPPHDIQDGSLPMLHHRAGAYANSLAYLRLFTASPI